MTKPITKKVTKKVVTKPIEAPSNYSISVHFNGTDFNASTETMEEAFEAIYALKPFFLKTKVAIKIEKDGKIAEKSIPPMLARRLFKLPKALKAMITRLSFK